jgi:hypothetical protein
VRSRTAGVMTTLMRNGRDRRSENPSGPPRRKSACFWLGPISGSHQGQRPQRPHRDGGSPPRDNRPNTWLHPNASQKVRFLLHRGRRPYLAHSRPFVVARQFDRGQGIAEIGGMLAPAGCDAKDPTCDIGLGSPAPWYPRPSRRRGPTIAVPSHVVRRGESQERDICFRIFSAGREFSCTSASLDWARLHRRGSVNVPWKVYLGIGTTERHT